jgi:hypothetical protein
LGTQNSVNYQHRSRTSPKTFAIITEVNMQHVLDWAIIQILCQVWNNLEYYSKTLVEGQYKLLIED